MTTRTSLLMDGQLPVVENETPTKSVSVDSDRNEREPYEGVEESEEEL